MKLSRLLLNIFLDIFYTFFAVKPAVQVIRTKSGKTYKRTKANHTKRDNLSYKGKRK